MSKSKHLIFGALSLVSISLIVLNFYVFLQNSPTYKVSDPVIFGASEVSSSLQSNSLSSSQNSSSISVSASNSFSSSSQSTRNLNSVSSSSISSKESLTENQRGDWTDQIGAYEN